MDSPLERPKVWDQFVRREYFVNSDIYMQESTNTSGFLKTWKHFLHTSWSQNALELNETPPFEFGLSRLGADSTNPSAAPPRFDQLDQPEYISANILLGQLHLIHPWHAGAMVECKLQYFASVASPNGKPWITQHSNVRPSTCTTWWSTHSSTSFFTYRGNRVSTCLEVWLVTPFSLLNSWALFVSLENICMDPKADEF